jgi:iron complex transport system substrate-binding protein
MQAKHSIRLPFFLIFLTAFAAAPSYAQNAVVLGGRAVVMVADAVYAFPSAPSRVIAVAGTDQGLGTFLSAVDPAFSKKPTLDRTAGAESFAALKPDLVVLKSAMKGSLGKGLAGLGLNALYVDLETPDDYYRDLAALGAVFGEEKRAQELVAEYKALAADTERRVSGRTKPKVLLVQAAAAAGVWEAPPESWMQTTLVRMAGGDPVWANAAPGNGWTRLGAEQIAAWNPEAVIVVSYREDSAETAAVFKADPRFAALAAVAAGRVFAMPQDFYSWDQPDTRWILGLRRIGFFLHPERFADVDPGAETRRFFRLLYGIDGPKFDSIIGTRLKGDHGVR